MIIQDMNENGCVGVRIESCGDKLVRAYNLQPFAEEELVKIRRILPEMFRFLDKAREGYGAGKNIFFPRTKIYEFRYMM